jgi:guanylate kinase
VKKRKKYLDNYQYLEAKVLKKNKKSRVVIHKRLESAPNIFESQSQYQTMTIESIGRGNAR